MGLFQFRVLGGMSLSQQLRAQFGNAPWRGHPSIAGHTHKAMLSQTAAV